MNYWKKYNEDYIGLTNEMILFNNSNEFNFIESNFYNHIRDIFSLTLSSILVSKRETTKVLDYGSNMVVWANLKNKIITENLHVDIYDPYESNYPKDLSFDFSYSLKNKIELIRNSSYDLTIFGSVAQYDVEFLSTTILDKLILGKHVLFTHTPMSLGESFSSKQSQIISPIKATPNSRYKGFQFIHSYKEIRLNIEKHGYKLIFKSVLPPILAGAEDQFEKDLIYANLLFIKTES